MPDDSCKFFLERLNQRQDFELKQALPTKYVNSKIHSVST